MMLGDGNMLICNTFTLFLCMSHVVKDKSFSFLKNDYYCCLNRSALSVDICLVDMWSFEKDKNLVSEHIACFLKATCRAVR